MSQGTTTFRLDGGDRWYYLAAGSLMASGLLVQSGLSSLQDVVLLVGLIGLTVALFLALSGRARGVVTIDSPGRRLVWVGLEDRLLRRDRTGEERSFEFNEITRVQVSRSVPSARVVVAVPGHRFHIRVPAADVAALKAALVA